MKTGLVACWALAASVCATAQVPTQTPAPEFSGSLRGYAEAAHLSGQGPLAQAQARAGSERIAGPATATGQVDATLKATWQDFGASATWLGAHDNEGGSHGHLRLDELSYAPSWGDLHPVIGKKVVAWDVGYAFRPNDLVQQEARRPLVPRTLEGRPLAMVERFGADWAWSLVAFHKAPRPEDANPFAPQENMAATRYYQRLGALDLYGFGGWGSQTRGTAGAAFSWVASDAIEVHGSLRRTGRTIRTIGRQLQPSPTPLAAANPYTAALSGAANQALLGMTWTGESKLSLIAEAWYDGTAPSDAFWRAWQARGDAIGTIPGAAATAQAIAGNLGWQAQQLNLPALRRGNLFLRAAWSLEAWEPTADVLYAPSDGGLVLTAGLAWKGDRLRIEGGARLFGGAGKSLYAQLPMRSLAYLAATLAF